MARKIDAKTRAHNNVDKAREKVQAAVILDPNGKKVGSVIHRWTYPATGGVCHTSFKLMSMSDYDLDPVVHYSESGGCGYDKEGNNLCWIFLEKQPQIEAITGCPYPEDPEGGLSCYLANHWRNYLEDAGYRVIDAL